MYSISLLDILTLPILCFVWYIDCCVAIYTNLSCQFDNIDCENVHFYCENHPQYKNNKYCHIIHKKCYNFNKEHKCCEKSCKTLKFFCWKARWITTTTLTRHFHDFITRINKKMSSFFQQPYLQEYFWIWQEISTISSSSQKHQQHISCQNAIFLRLWQQKRSFLF